MVRLFGPVRTNMLCTPRIACQRERIRQNARSISTSAVTHLGLSGGRHPDGAESPKQPRLRLRSVAPVSKPSAESVLPVVSILIALLCLALSGCADLAATDSVGHPQVGTPPPDEKKLAELVGSAFKTTKLSGSPEASPVRATHDNQIGDWMVCVKSSAPDETLKYAVFIKSNSILDIRSRVSIDGCNNETYRPVEIASLKATPVDDHVVTPPPPSPGSHRRH